MRATLSLHQWLPLPGNVRRKNQETACRPTERASSLQVGSATNHQTPAMRTSTSAVRARFRTTTTTATAAAALEANRL